MWAIPLAGVIAARSRAVAALLFGCATLFAIGTWIVAEVFRLLASQLRCSAAAPA